MPFADDNGACEVASQFSTYLGLVREYSTTMVMSLPSVGVSNFDPILPLVQCVQLSPMDPEDGRREITWLPRYSRQVKLYLLPGAVSHLSTTYHSAHC